MVKCEMKMKSLIFLLVITFPSVIFAHPADGQGEVKVTQIAKATTQWDGTPLPNYPSKNPEITILSYEIAPGTRLPTHKHPVINAGVILQGSLSVVSKDGKRLILNPGDSIVELVDQWHYGLNEGPEPVKLIMFYAGELGVPLVIKE